MSSPLRRADWLGKFTGPQCSRRRPLSFQVVNGVKGGTRTVNTRTIKPARRSSTKAPLELDEMGKKEKPGGPKQLSLRNTGAHSNSTISFVQILGTGMDTGDTSPCVLLFFDQRRFIFNAGEGLQRFCIEHRVKLSKINHVFLTRVSSETAGGLPGLLLTLAGIGEAGMAVNIWGPSDLQYLVDAMRTFVPNASVVHTHSFGGPGGIEVKSEASGAQVLMEDDVVKITAVLLKPYSLAAKGGSQARSKRARLEQSSSAGSEQSVVDEGSDLSVVYVCELPEVKGRFDLKKAQAFFNRPGPHYGMLQAGKSVMGSDGKTMVHPSDVMDPSSPGPIFILVDCPSSEYIPALLTNPVLTSFQVDSSGVTTKQVTLMVHISPASVTQLTEYRGWMEQFPGARHVLAGHGMLNMAQPVLKSSARVVSRLNLICPQVFSVATLQPNLASTEGTKVEKSSEMISVAENLLRFRLRPLSALGLDRSAVPEPFSVAGVQEQVANDIPELLEASRKLAQVWSDYFSKSDATKGGSDPDAKIVDTFVEEPWLLGSNPLSVPSHSTNNITTIPSDIDLSEVDAQISKLEDLVQESCCDEEIPACLQGVSREEMEMVFLGTGSSQPSKYRNVSAIYVHLFDRGGILLDCGEGTYAQLKRRYGHEGADKVLAGLKCVWISHIHADHHTGLARILSVRKSILEKMGVFTPVLVVGPKQLKRFLDAYGHLEDLGMEFVDCSQTTIDADDIAEAENLASAKDGNDRVKVSSTTSRNARSRSPDRESIEGLGSGSGVGLIRKASAGDGGQLSPRKGQMRNFWLLPGANLQAGIDWTGREKLRHTLSSLGLVKLTSVPVVHCAHAFGVVLESEPRILRSGDTGNSRPGWKVVYSGDTRPCNALVEASRGATVLIHEATFDDGMPEEALAKKHSLTREAIETGVSAGVYRTILTHFSQRYPKIPVFDDSYTSRTCIAFDMMSANLADLPLLPSLLPALKLLFKDELMAIEEEACEGGDEASNF